MGPLTRREQRRACSRRAFSGMSAEPFESGPDRSPDVSLRGFQALMRYRIGDILLVSSLYDLYLFEEDGQLYELIRSEYQGLQLSHPPELSSVHSFLSVVAPVSSAFFSATAALAISTVFVGGWVVTTTGLK